MSLYLDLRDKVEGGFKPLSATAGPVLYAARLARYIRDASTIYARTMNEYGRAPSKEHIQAMISAAREESARVRLSAERDTPDESEDAQWWATPGIIRLAEERRVALEKIAAQRALQRLDEAEGDGTRERPRRDMVAARDIIAMTATSFGLTYADLTGRSRRRNIVAVRHMAAWILIKRGRLSTSHVGRALGGRDHSSAIHARNMFEERATAEQRDFALRLARWSNPLAEVPADEAGDEQGDAA